MEKLQIGKWAIYTSNETAEDLKKDNLHRTYEIINKVGMKNLIENIKNKLKKDNE